MNYKLQLNDKVTGYLSTGELVEGRIWNIDYDKSQVEILRNGMIFQKHWFSINNISYERHMGYNPVLQDKYSTWKYFPQYEAVFNTLKEYGKPYSFPDIYKDCCFGKFGKINSDQIHVYLDLMVRIGQVEKYSKNYVTYYKLNLKSIRASKMKNL